MNKNFALLLGAMLSAIPGFTLLTGSLVLLCGGTMNAWLFPAGVILALGMGYLLTRSVYAPAEALRKWLQAAVLLLCIIPSALWLGNQLFDYSWDGQWYHQDIIIALKNGWNPVYMPHSQGFHTAQGMWIDHYTKGMETVWASVYCTTGQIESAKGVNLLMVLGSFLLTYVMLSYLFRHLSTAKRTFLSILFSLTPVVLSQWLTYYIDWSLYTLLLSLVSLLLLTPYVAPGKVCLYTIIGNLLFFTASVKLNTFFWVLLTLGIFGAIWTIRRRYADLRRLAICGFVGCSAGVLLGGFNPYVTNTMDHGNPAYPLIGEETVDIMTEQENPAIMNKGRIFQVLWSYFSYPQNSNLMPSAPAIPLTIRGARDLSVYMAPDVRTAGFGPLFSGITILALIVYFATTDSDKERRKYFAILLIALFGGLFILPSGWWARYVPFWGCFPLVLLLYSEQDPHIRRWALWLRRTAYTLIVANLLIVGGMALGSCVLNTAKVNAIVDRLRTAEGTPEINFGIIPSFKEKLRGIPYSENTAAIPDSAAQWEYLYFDRKPGFGIFYNRQTAVLGAPQSNLILKLQRKLMPEK